MASSMAVIYDQATGREIMHVVPTYDWELDDKAFHPPGSVHLLIPMEQYQAMDHAAFHAHIAAHKKV